MQLILVTVNQIQFENCTMMKSKPKIFVNYTRLKNETFHFFITTRLMWTCLLYVSRLNRLKLLPINKNASASGGLRLTNPYQDSALDPTVPQTPIFVPSIFEP